MVDWSAFIEHHECPLLGRKRTFREAGQIGPSSAWLINIKGTQLPLAYRDVMNMLESSHLTPLAAQYRSRAETADPEIGRILGEIADDLEGEALQLCERESADG